MKRIAIIGLPAEPLAAAGDFYRQWLPRIETLTSDGGDLLIAFGATDHTHREWRRAAVAGLARARAPQRVNAVAGGDAALSAFAAYLEAAPGVTGQYFESDDEGAGDCAA